MIIALAGGVGAAKFLLGLSHVLPPEQITIVGNTGDDIELLGLRVCPDLDTIAYTLAGRVNAETGWGLQGDTVQCLQALAGYGCETWFKLGDRDLATHVWRTHLLREGVALSEITRRLCESLGMRSRLIPMTESYVPTHVLTSEGNFHLQEYFVRHQCRPAVKDIQYLNVEQSRPAAGIEEAILSADAIVLCPSNPFISIGPILSVPGLKDFLQSTKAPIIAVTPLIGGRALKGPAAKMLAELGYAVSAATVAKLYQNLIDCFILDEQDAHLREEIEALEVEVVITNTVMNTLEDKIALAQQVVGTYACSPRSY